MNSKEKIKDWVKNLKLQSHTIQNLGINALSGFQLACDDVIAFIDSLPEEPLSKDLEREIGLYTTHSLLKKRNHDTGVYHLTQKDCDDIARYFAEWQKQQMIKKVVEWLNSNTVTMKADHCEYTASSYNLRKEKFIIAFKLAMEE